MESSPVGLPRRVRAKQAEAPAGASAMRRRCCAIPADVEGIRNVNDATRWLCPPLRARKTRGRKKFSTRPEHGASGSRRCSGVAVGEPLGVRPWELAVELEPLAPLGFAGPADVRGGVRARAATVRRPPGRSRSCRARSARPRARPCRPAACGRRPSRACHRPRATGPLFLVALRTRNVTKPPTRSTTSTIGITYSMRVGYPWLSGTKRSRFGSPRLVRTRTQTQTERRPDGRQARWQDAQARRSPGVPRGRGTGAGARALRPARDGPARRDPGHRRDAGGHELPPRRRLVPSVPAAGRHRSRSTASTATSGWVGTSSSARWRATTSSGRAEMPCARTRATSTWS